MWKIFLTSIVMASFIVDSYGASVSGSCRAQACLGLEQIDSSLPSNTYGCGSGGSSSICYSGTGGGGSTTSTIFRAQYCTSCPSGYELKQYTATSTEVRGCTVNYTLCVPSCPSECPSPSWTNFGTGAQKRCETRSAPYKCGYRCATNYYGNANSSGKGCTTCPSGGSSVAGSTSVTNCYVPAGYNSSDSTGKWTYTQACFWSN